jgi:chromosome segregation ATPase
MEMENTQSAQLLKWLEEERRKDKAQISTLQERITGQEQTVTELTRRLQELETNLKASQTSLLRIQQIESMMEEYKTSLMAIIERRDDEHKKSSRETERVRAIELEGLTRQWGDVRKELPRFGKIEEDLVGRRAEEKRLGDAVRLLQTQVDSTAQRIDGATRGIPYLEEGRRQDTRRIAAVEQDVINQVKKIEAALSKLQVLEDALGKVQPKLDQMNSRLAEQDKVVDAIKVSGFQIQQQIKITETDVAKFRAQIAEFSDIAAKVRDQSQQNDRARAELLAFQETLRQRASEVSEVQRLHEERTKRIVEESQTADEKRWSTQTAKLSEHWQEHERLHARLEEQVSAAKESIPAPVTEALEELRADYDKLVKGLFDTIASMLESKRSTLPSVSVSPAIVPDDGGGAARHAQLKRK